MRYIGGKTELLGHIHDEVMARNAASVIDIFAGSGVVSTFLSQNGYRIFSNDFLYFSYVSIARYDYPEIHGVTGIRAYGDKEKSDFCKRNKVSTAFCNLIEKAKVKSIIISYSNEGLLPEQDLEEICRNYVVKDSFIKKEIPYRRFKSHEGENMQVKELLLSFDKW